MIQIKRIQKKRPEKTAYDKIGSVSFSSFLFLLVTTAFALSSFQAQTVTAAALGLFKESPPAVSEATVEDVQGDAEVVSETAKKPEKEPAEEPPEIPEHLAKVIERLREANPEISTREIAQMVSALSFYDEGGYNLGFPIPSIQENSDDPNSPSVKKKKKDSKESKVTPKTP